MSFQTFASWWGEVTTSALIKEQEIKWSEVTGVKTKIERTEKKVVQVLENQFFGTFPETNSKSHCK